MPVAARKTLETAYTQAVKDYIKAKKTKRQRPSRRNSPGSKPTRRSPIEPPGQGSADRQVGLGGQHHDALSERHGVGVDPKGVVVSTGKWKVETDGVLVEWRTATPAGARCVRTENSL